MIDLVYPIGNGSKWDDNELRYSLRSIEKHLTNYRKVYIIGNLPRFLNTAEVIHIPFEDKHGHERNIMEKVKHVCSFPGLSERFLFMNDDHYLNTAFDALRFPYYYWKTLDDKMATVVGGYGESVRNTLHAMKARRQPRNFYDIHTPVIYDKKLFVDIMSQFDWTTRNGYVIKSLYCNMARVKGVPQPDGKIHQNRTVFQLEKQVAQHFVFSSSDKVTPEMRTLLSYLYPNASKYER